MIKTKDIFSKLVNDPEYQKNAAEQREKVIKEYEAEMKKQ